jgi:hypothetical protein
VRKNDADSPNFSAARENFAKSQLQRKNPALSSRGAKRRGDLSVNRGESLRGEIASSKTPRNDNPGRLQQKRRSAWPEGALRCAQDKLRDRRISLAHEPDASQTAAIPKFSSTVSTVSSSTLAHRERVARSAG